MTRTVHDYYDEFVRKCDTTEPSSAILAALLRKIRFRGRFLLLAYVRYLCIAWIRSPAVPPPPVVETKRSFACARKSGGSSAFVRLRARQTFFPRCELPTNKQRSRLRNYSFTLRIPTFVLISRFATVSRKRAALCAHDTKASSLPTPHPTFDGRRFELY